MTFEKGKSGNPHGRTKGKTNKITAEIKQKAIELLEEFGPELVKWIKEVAVKDPEKAYYMVMYPQEFAFPKLARTEIKAGLDEATLEVVKTYIPRKDA